MESLLRHGAVPIVVGHRGASADHPENTLQAFEAVYAAGAGWIEADVQPCADGIPVLLHDLDVGRTTNGAGAVRELTWDQLVALDAGSWRGAASGFRIPTLAEVAKLLDHGRFLLLEIKGEHTLAQVAAEMQIVNESVFDSRIFVQSFEITALQHVRQLAPDRPVGLLVEDLHDDPVAVCTDLGATAYNPDHLALLRRPEVVAQLHAANIAVLAWTPDLPEEWAALTAIGVDGIITNRPAHLLAWQALQAMQPEPPALSMKAADLVSESL